MQTKAQAGPLQATVTVELGPCTVLVNVAKSTDGTSLIECGDGMMPVLRAMQYRERKEVCHPMSVLRRIHPCAMHRADGLRCYSACSVAPT